MKVWVHIVDDEPIEVRMGKNVENGIFQSKVEALLNDWGWKSKAVNELFSAEDLYDKMKTNTGRIEVENIIRDYAEEEAERTENCDGWFEVEVTE